MNITAGAQNIINLMSSTIMFLTFQSLIHFGDLISGALEQLTILFFTAYLSQMQTGKKLFASKQDKIMFSKFI